MKVFRKHLVVFFLVCLSCGAHAANHENLPQHLAQIIENIEENRVDYPQRASSIQSMNRYIANGDFDMAMFKAEEIQEKQANLSSGQMPQQLAQLIKRIEENRVDYPQRASSIQSMNRYIANGDFDMAMFKAEEIQEKQANLSSGQMPQQLAQLIKRIEENRVDYPQRASSIQSMNRYIANGDFNMAMFKAEEIQEKQANLSSGQMPQQLAQLIKRIEENRVDYPQRASSIQSMNRYIANGDFDMAMFKAEEIQEKQANLSSGQMPQQLAQLIKRIEENRVDYPQRASSIQSMNRYIANGDFDMAMFKAEEIQERQSNLSQ